MKPAHVIGGALAVGALAWLLSGDDAAEVGDGPSPSFTWRDVERSAAAARLGLPNAAPPAARERARILAARVLEPLTARVGPLTVSSWYRSPAVNAAAGGATSSDHLTGGAVDISRAGVSPRDLARAVLALDLPFDQMFGYRNTGHIHLSDRYPAENRRQIRMTEADGTLTPWDPT